MKVYIRSTGNISPQHTLDTEFFLRQRENPTSDFFKSIEPQYERFVDSKMIRRMSRIVKMGVAAAMTCLGNAGVEQPAAILTATAYGCLEDSSGFLRRMIEFEEKLLSPTAFIQSTHNTVGAQIALLLKCHAYNNTIVHRSFSFENALTESTLLLAEGVGPVLVGAVDEITDDRHSILRRFGLYKKRGKVPGNIAGEGAAFFLIDKEPGDHPCAIINDVCRLYNPESYGRVQEFILEMLKQNNLGSGDIGLVLTSHSGNPERDIMDDWLLDTVFRGKPGFPFKSLCGDYPTASGFACWLAAILLKEQKKPVWMTGISFPLKYIFIHHRDGNKYHSFYLMSAC
jgi:3-oxoacyl-[acyl-carrier-protein] synthase II